MIDLVPKRGGEKPKLAGLVNSALGRFGIVLPFLAFRHGESDSNHMIYPVRFTSLDDAVSNSPAIANAYETSKVAHKNDLRENGEPYFSHPRGVAEYVIGHLERIPAEDQEMQVVLALLHDVSEAHPDAYPISRIRQIFDDTYGIPVSEKLRFLDKNHVSERDSIHVAEQDKLVGLVKSGDKYHNLKTLHGKKDPVKRQEIIRGVPSYIRMAEAHGWHDISSDLAFLALLYRAEHENTLPRLGDIPKARPAFVNPGYNAPGFNAP